MEVLERVGTREQKDRWLKPLLNGEIRSAYAMTEPDVASSDAKNISCQAALVGDEWVINGEKYYISGAGDPRCKIMIVMVQTDPDAPPHLRQSQILVPTDAPGFEVLGPMHVFGKDDAPHGHMHIRFDDCRVPEGEHPARRGPRLRDLPGASRAGPHPSLHALDRRRRASHRADGQAGPHARGVRQADRQPRQEHRVIAKARIEIEAMRMMVLKAAKAMDVLGNSEARVWVSAIKAMVPERVCRIIDDAIQIHGATGVSQWTPLADMYASQRTLRLADGPDEVHWFVVGRAELARWVEEGASEYDPKASYLARPTAGRGVQRSLTRRSPVPEAPNLDPRAEKLFDLSGKVAVVTGGSRGLGARHGSRFLAANGAHVRDREPQGGGLPRRSRRRSAVRPGARRWGWPATWGAGRSATLFVERSYATFGRVDVLVNNAGMSPLYPSLAELGEDLYDKVLAVNLKGPFRLTARVGTRMQAGEEAPSSTSAAPRRCSRAPSRSPTPLRRRASTT